MSPRRAELPGKDALFGPAPPPLAPEAPPPAAPAAAAASPAPPEAPALPERHVQLCVWMAPEVGERVDLVRARLLMDRGLKVTKSRIVEVLLERYLDDLDLLEELLLPG